MMVDLVLLNYFSHNWLLGKQVRVETRRLRKMWLTLWSLPYGKASHELVVQARRLLILRLSFTLISVLG
jgi:hypothetical protein